jgi:hypothetical protein
LVALCGGAKQLAQLMNFLTEIGYGHGGELDDFLLGRCWLYVPLGFSPAYSALYRRSENGRIGGLADIARRGFIPGFQSQATCRPAASSIRWSAIRMAISSASQSAVSL